MEIGITRGKLSARATGIRLFENIVGRSSDPSRQSRETISNDEGEVDRSIFPRPAPCKPL